MNITLLAVGDEVLYGYTTNSNASFIAQNLLERGFLPTTHTVVGDNAGDLQQALVGALTRGHLVIMTGGLGPTLDDRTRNIVSSLFLVPLVKQESLRAQVEKISCNQASVEDQLIQPQGALFLQNTIGTASGFILEDQKRFPGALLIAVPGIPTEMKMMFVDQVLPFIMQRYGAENRLLVKTLHFVGLIESQLDPILRTIEQLFPRVVSGIYPSFATVTVQLRGYNASELELAARPFLETFSDNIYQSGSGTLAEALHLELIKHGVTLATAESCTGGGLAAAFVANPDASQYFKGSVVAYCNSVKEKQLSVDPKILAQYGAVSEEVTAQMALGVCQALGSSLGISVSGILGPAGGTVEKPVGTVSASIAYKGKVALSWTMHFKGSRHHISQKTVHHILAKVYFFLRQGA